MKHTGTPTDHVRNEKAKRGVGTTEGQVERYAKWAILLTLVAVLTVLTVKLLPTTQSTHAYGLRRDLSKASTRLVGHWQSDSGDHDLYFTFDPSLKVGTYVVHNHNQRPSGPIRFKLLYELGELIVLRDFNDYSDLEAKTGLSIAKSEIRCRIPESGQSMSREYRLNGTPMLTVFRYVDNRTTP